MPTPAETSIKNLSVQHVPAKYSFLNEMNLGVGILALLAWVVLSFLYALTIARKRGPVLLFATYAGLAVAAIAQNLNISPALSLSSLQKNNSYLLFVFIIVSLLAFVVAAKTLRRHSVVHNSRYANILMGALEVGAYLSSLGTFLPVEMKTQITGFASMLFLTPWTHVLWLVLPLLVLLIAERVPKDHV